VLGREASLGHPEAATDFERQLSLGTYVLGNARMKLLLDGLPYERILALGEDSQPPHTLAFYLPGSTVVLLLERMPVS